jgi:iron complex outermembrane recepter protein
MRRKRTLTCWIACLISIGAAAQQSSQDLTTISLEDLLNTKITTVSKSPQTLRDSAASVSVITSDDIRRSGAESIPELLRHVIGLDVARVNGTTWAISSRGFNSQWANKMLVMVDGRTVYDPLFSGVFWDIQDTLLEDIDRIEITRGPGGSVWGANAVNGVINIITKPSSATQGFLAMGGGGNIQRGFGGFRYGGKLSDNTQYRVFTKFDIQDADWKTTETNASDSAQWRAGFRSDTKLGRSDSLTLTGEVYTGSDNTPWTLPTLTAPYHTEFLNHAGMYGGFMAQEWDHVYKNGSDSTLRTYYEYGDRAWTNMGLHRSTVGAEFQHNFAWGSRQQFSWGGGLRYTDDSTASKGLGVALSPALTENGIGDTFVEDSISFWRDRLTVTLGSKLQYDNFSGYEFLPTVRALYKLNRQNRIWVAVSRAARTPSRADLGIVADLYTVPAAPVPVLVQLHGNKKFGSEHMAAYEAGYRWQPNKRFTLEASAFYNHYTGVETAVQADNGFEMSPTPHAVADVVYVNGLHGPSYGGEIETHWSLSERFKLSASYALLRASLGPDPGINLLSPPSNNDSPRHTLLAEGSYRLRKTVEFGTFVRAMSSAKDAGAAKYTQMNAHVRWILGEHSDFSINGEDLLSQKTPEFSIPETTVSALLGRRVFAKFTWQF